MVALANPIWAFARHPLVANMAEAARPIGIEMFGWMLGTLLPQIERVAALLRRRCVLAIEGRTCISVVRRLIILLRLEKQGRAKASLSEPSVL